MTGHRPTDRGVVLLLAAVVALAVSAAWHLLSSRGHAPGVATGPAASASRSEEQRFTDFEQRLHELEQRALEARQSAESVGSGPARHPVTGDDEDPAVPASTTPGSDALAVLRDLDARLSRLEALQQSVEDEEARREEEHARRLAEQRQRIVDAPRVILDPTQTALAKSEAWEALRRADASTWTDAVVAEIVRVAQTSDDPEVRANIWRCADADRAHRLLRQPLLDAVLRDADERVREEAAETLENYVDDPAVVTVLERIVQSDASPAVRDEARRALERGRRRR